MIDNRKTQAKVLTSSKQTYINNELAYNLSFKQVYENLVDDCNKLKQQNFVNVNCKNFELQQLTEIIADSMEIAEKLDYKNKENDFKQKFSIVLKNLNMALTYVDYLKICETVKESVKYTSLHQDCDIPKNCYTSSPFEIATRTRKCLGIKNNAFPVGIIKENKFGIFKTFTNDLSNDFEKLKQQLSKILPILAGNDLKLENKKNEETVKINIDNTLTADEKKVTDAKITTVTKKQTTKNKYNENEKNNYSNFSQSENFDSSNSTENLDKSSDIEIEKNMLSYQNQLVNEQSEDMLEKLNFLADNNLKNIKNTFSKIDDILSKSVPKYNKNLFETVIKENPGGFENIENLLKDNDFENKSLVEKNIYVNAKMNLWNYLYKIKAILPFGVPVKKINITSVYGYRDNPTEQGKDFHTGIDFSGNTGIPVFSTSAGKIIVAGNAGDYGLMIKIDHGIGFSTLYAHLSKIFVKKGDIVNDGDKIGEIGSTGRSTGSHLHYEIRYNDKTFDPISFVTVNR